MNRPIESIRIRRLPLEVVIQQYALCQDCLRLVWRVEGNMGACCCGGGLCNLRDCKECAATATALLAGARGNVAGCVLTVPSWTPDTGVILDVPLSESPLPWHVHGPVPCDVCGHDTTEPIRVPKGDPNSPEENWTFCPLCFLAQDPCHDPEPPCIEDWEPETVP